MVGVKRIKHICLILILTLSLFLMAPVRTVEAREKSRPYRILCISSYNYAYSIVPDQLSGIKDGLGNLSYDIEYEFLDSKKYYKTQDLDMIHNYMAYKIHQADPYDLLILCDDNALHFWKNDRQGLFANVPVVFMGINSVSAAENAAESSRVTGIVEVTDYLSSFELMHKLFPRRKHVVAMVDSSITGRGEYALFTEKSKEYSEFTYSHIITQDYSKRGIADALSKLGKEDIILYMDFLVDGDGNLYTEQSASAFVSEYAPDVPIFRVSSRNICNGVLGGIVYSHYDAGFRAGEMAVSILKGTKPSKIPLVYTPFNTVVFEQEAMDHFNIRRVDLPKGTTILNENWSFSRFYEENQLLTHMILLVILLLIILIVGLWRGIKHREKMANQDFLTKMPNRLYINSRIRKQIERREPFGIMMMDVDYFKSINDTLGHAVGDELLVVVAKRLKAIADNNLIFARIGGDEFVGLSTGKRVEEGDEICQKVLDSIRQDCHLSCGMISITSSIGYAAFPLHTDNPDKVMNYADAALYEVKKMGRNGYQIFKEELLKNLEK